MGSSFHSKTAILLAAMCYQTYPLYLEGTLVLPSEYKLIYTIRALANVENPTKIVFGFIAESPDQIIIAFRGYAAYPEDLLAAYDILQVQYPYVPNAGNTSRGFTCIYRSTRTKLIHELNKLSATKQLYITGHNYGGALATLAALDIAVNTKFKNPVVYTYGSPRVASPAFASKFDLTVKNSIRIVNIHDIISTLPERSYPPPFTKDELTYEHVKTKYPVSFQLNSLANRNHEIVCYFKNLSKKNPYYASLLCEENPGLCPDTSWCVPFKGICSPVEEEG
ncbi:lipase [Paenibacillus sp. KS1]|uniref:lipase family protein n=1 Tax=Paenibacillus sp. KS1 TaxID=1849249 RepID=UPI0008064A5D|nr:lipase family protein [Paenibacillus sp. KS1]OBY80751.1 lipase [Paenibacillus sp. KS1]